MFAIISPSVKLANRDSTDGGLGLAWAGSNEEGVVGLFVCVGGSPASSRGGVEIGPTELSVVDWDVSALPDEDSTIGVSSGCGLKVDNMATMAISPTTQTRLVTVHPGINDLLP